MLSLCVSLLYLSILLTVNCGYFESLPFMWNFEFSISFFLFLVAFVVTLCVSEAFMSYASSVSVCFVCYCSALLNLPGMLCNNNFIHNSSRSNDFLSTKMIICFCKKNKIHSGLLVFVKAIGSFLSHCYKALSIVSGLHCDACSDAFDVNLSH